MTDTHICDTAAPKTTPAFTAVNDEFNKVRRDYFLDNLYISKHVREEFDPSEDYEIWVINAFEKRFISLQAGHWDRPCRAWVNKDLTVNTGADGVGSGGIFMPVRYDGDDYWYDGDEEQEVGKTVLPKHTRWTSQVAILKKDDVQVYTVTEATLNLIIDKFDLCSEE